MTRSAAFAILVFAACGAPAQQAPTLPSVSDTSPAPAPADPPAAMPSGVAAQPALLPTAPPAVKATASFESILAAGPLPVAQVRARLDRHRDALAACARHAGESVALELAFSLTPDDRIPHVAVHDETRDALVSCVAAALGSLETTIPTDGEPTDVYVIVALDRDGAARAKRPPPPSLAIDFEATCSAAKRSGAITALPAARPDIMKAYLKKTVRHPAVTHLFWRLGNAPPQELKALQKKARRDAKPRKCEDPGW
ncbi:MAG TPA: hypothetical protein VFQ53_13820 [Kofleriaceae bacterium]|nr:hypothetical protein [Kofleriaceae bacterium]